MGGVELGVYELCQKFGWEGEVSERSAEVMGMFGLTVDRMAEQGTEHKCSLDIRKGDVVFITGASGAGKSVLLRELARQVGSDGVDMDSIELHDDRSVVDCFAGELVECLRYLSKAGLSDVYCVLNRPGFLSEGQKWRFRLAMGMASGGEFLFCDEFCSNLDRITACVIAHNVRRFADSSGKIFVLASSHEDIIGDLRPDVVVTRYLSGEAAVVYRDGARGE